MKTALIAIMAFLSTSLRATPDSGKVVQIEYNNQTNRVANQQIVEYTQGTEVKPSIVPTISASSTNKWWRYTREIKPVTRSGDDLLVLVNKEYQLPQSYVPSDLVLASNSGLRLGGGYYLRNIVIPDLTNLVNAAKAASIDLSIVSGYRSYNTQAATYNHWVSVNGIDGADKISARAGHSQHQLGTAIDFSSSQVADGLGGSFSTTKASAWLAENAWQYGFVISYPSGYESTTGYSYESWHYRYIGVANAQEMHNSGMILEIYLESKN
jgi:zinc D-Ala-D-Ala carboxypeptidase